MSSEIFFKNIDHIFAAKVLKKIPCHPSCYDALSYLFAAARKGHHCVTIQEEALVPGLQEVLEKETQDLDPDLDLTERVIAGLLALPEAVQQEEALSLTLKPIVKAQNSYYLQKYYFLEKEIASYVAELVSAPMQEKFSQEEILEALTPYHSYLNEEQQQAVLQSLLYPFFALTGGPGTGKSYIIHYALKVYTALSQKIGKEPRILVAAPTGKAATLLKEKLSMQHAHLTVSTLHSALKIKREKDLSKEAILFYDCVIVDECSMIDLHLWRVFLSALELGTRVIVMGDPYQLPPVESGMVFAELVEVIPRVHLQRSMRVEHPGLLNIAGAIKAGEMADVKELLATSEEICYQEYDQEVEISCLKIESLIEKFFERDLLKCSLCFLSPLLEGTWGVNTLNTYLHGRSIREGRPILSIPIIITQTDYGQELYNGDVGVLLKYQDKTQQNSALFGGSKKIEEALLPKYDYAYALSVHKSQGSEYEDVVLFLPGGSEFFGKEILYTAVTRAKKSLTIFAKKGVLEKCLRTDSKKNSNLARHILLKQEVGKSKF